MSSLFLGVIENPVHQNINQESIFDYALIVLRVFEDYFLIFFLDVKKNIHCITLFCIEAVVLLVTLS